MSFAGRGKSLVHISFRILFFYVYLFMIVTERERERGRDTDRGRSRLHAPEARCGIRSWVSRIVPWAKGRRQTTAPPKDPEKFFFKILFIYSRETHTEREAQTQAEGEGEAGSMQGAQCRTRSRLSRIIPQAAGRAKPLSHQGCPPPILFEK